MNLRRLMQIARRGRSLPEGRVVHHSKNLPPMAEMGHLRPRRRPLPCGPLPLRPESRRRAGILPSVALGQELTFPLFAASA
jgi:hypothetical protein